MWNYNNYIMEWENGLSLLFYIMFQSQKIHIIYINVMMDSHDIQAKGREGEEERVIK